MIGSRKIKIIKSAIISLFFAASFSNARVFADAWFSEPYSGGGGGGGSWYSDQQDVSCYFGDPRIHCSGISWIFYKYIGKDAYMADAEYRFPEGDNIADSDLPKISQKCATYGNNTGFWHQGRNMISQLDALGGLNLSHYIQPNGAFFPAGSNYGYTSSTGSLGHFLTTTYKYVSDNFKYYKGGNNQITGYHPSYGEYRSFPQPYQILYKKIKGKWVPLYQATHYATSTSGKKGSSPLTDVFTAYKSARAANGDGVPKVLDSNLYAFCWGEALERGGDFSATVTAKVNGQTGSTIEVDSDTFELSFTHKLKRNKDDYDGAVNGNIWTVSGSGGSDSGKENFATADLSKNVSVLVNKKKKSPNIGATEEYCSTITFRKDFNSSGTIGSDNGNAKGCIKVHRKVNVSFNTTNECSATTGASSTKKTTNKCNTTLETNSKQWSINHQSQATSSFTGELVVPAGKLATNNEFYKHSALKYGLENVKCVRSHNVYTQYQYLRNGTISNQGPTLAATSKYDLPGKYAPKNNKQGSSYYYPGCDDGTTKWQKWSPKTTTTKWDNNQEPNTLKLPDDRSKDVVSVTKKSQMKVIDNYKDNKWSSTWAGNEVQNTIKRYRRYVNFSSGATIYADAGKKSKATTKYVDPEKSVTVDKDGYFTVTFKYQVNRGGTDNVKDTNGDRLKVSNSWKSRETITAIDGSNKTYPSNGTYGQWHDYGSFESSRETTNASGQKIETISGMLYYGQKVKICGNVSYGKRIRELEEGSEISKQITEGIGCVNVERKDGTCTTYNGTKYNFTHKNGYNIAELKVENGTTGASNYTNWSTMQSHNGDRIINTADVWARPGDNVRYAVNYCMGANYAHSVHEKEGINDGGTDTDLSATANTTADINEEQKTNYLFGDDISTYADNKTTPKTIHFTKRNSSGAITNDSLQKNIGAISSPSAGMSKYKCEADNIDSGGLNSDIKNKQSIAYKIEHPQTFMAGYYQIAGKMKKDGSEYKVSCNNRTKTLDVGTKMNEDIIWTDLRYVNSVNATNKGNFLSRAYIKVPYNYKAEPYVNASTEPKGTVQIGSKINFKPGIAVFPRKNCAFVNNGYGESGNQDTNCRNDSGSISEYATITKPTKVELSAYVAKDNEGKEKIRDISNKTIEGVRANTKSNLLGITGHSTGNLNSGGPEIDGGYDVLVPDNVSPGDKICVEMTITPADSHDNPSAPRVQGDYVGFVISADPGPALKDKGDSSATTVSCLTAVKRPTISIENSNLYSATDITTSIASRYSNGEEYLFGSWSEYGVYGRVSIDWHKQGISSGARLGYNNNAPYINEHYIDNNTYAQVKTVITEWIGGPDNGKVSYDYAAIKKEQELVIKTYRYDTDNKKYPAEPTETRPGTIVKPVYNGKVAVVNSKDDSNIISSNDATVCNFSTQTFANSDCNNDNAGSTANKKIGAEAATSFYEKILDKFDAKKTNLSQSKCDKGVGVECITISEKKYIDFASVNTQAELQNKGGNTQTLYKATADNAYIGNKIDLSTDPVTKTKNGDNVKTSSVIVYKATDIIIDADIVSGNIGYQDLSDMHMPIIIADNVYITGKPTRIDAIIIAKEKLNTCTWNNSGELVKIGNGGNLTSDVCGNELRFTAPVVVKGTLILNRTHGAGPGGQKVQRAEIFELNPATYLWSYDQMTRYSQAITTYSRELPTRY